MSPPQDQPGLIASHAQYVKGAAEETIGNLTNSPAWKASGTQDKEQGIAAMKQAGAARDEAQKGLGGGAGTVEKKVGELVGCEGMEREGARGERK